MIEQPLYLGEIGGGRDVEGDHAEPLYALAADSEFVKRVDHALPRSSRAAVTEHDEADGAVLRTPNHLPGPLHAFLVGRGGHDVPTGDAAYEPRRFLLVGCDVVAAAGVWGCTASG